jgi:hypothetical protein
VLRGLLPSDFPVETICDNQLGISLVLLPESSERFDRVLCSLVVSDALEEQQTLSAVEALFLVE